MSSSRAVILTHHASRYLQQLSKHWAHKFETEFTPFSSKIALPLGETRLSANDKSLTIEITALKSEDLTVLRNVVQRHIERFAFKETLEFDWQPLS
ncbi:DUF2218 domain-containing protein [Agrobacterium bohemicum]|uniref:2,4-dihydroxyhept-2-ene-1,7-dioic acid aldolase n=1 Tax=Agrobacterium bohemicum TaxID=2052828 RepID=A0A135P848_9HYPH|nr:DUF2218 domain-containing protein [Agrobacterium bohemicum]KXG87528.1 2,4-dihydroxyhept-2-ene-1,7-dioic acid aldolase [Agrobacterium bohemicum]